VRDPDTRQSPFDRLLRRALLEVYVVVRRAQFAPRRSAAWTVLEPSTRPCSVADVRRVCRSILVACGKGFVCSRREPSQRAARKGLGYAQGRLNAYGATMRAVAIWDSDGPICCRASARWRADWLVVNVTWKASAQAALET
jgi:hypothetical protein